MRRLTHLLQGCAVGALVLLSNPAAALALPADPNTLVEPPVFSSQAGVLDLLVIARTSPTPILNLPNTKGWVYEICRRPSATATDCPAGSSVAPYGGTRLAVMPGDKVRIRLVNQLPPIPEAKHAQDVSLDLALNPTNLHTHGMIVEPRYPTIARPTWGDNVFVYGFNPLNGLPQPALGGRHAHGSVTVDPIDYEIDIPANHPSGQFWFHPHIHGIALNQVSAGLAGIITVGSVADYACEDALCLKPWAPANVRHLILKDAQVESNDGLSTQQDPQFCPPSASATDAPRLGQCAGQLAPGSGVDHSGGHWIFSVNGQVYPTIPVAAGRGDIWRLTNASGSASYDLHLWDEVAKSDAIFQVVSVDGVSVTSPVGATAGQLGTASATKIRSVACPASPPSASVGPLPICATSLRMMPSSRVEIRVAYRDANGRLAAAPANARFTLRTVGFDTGGDQWPAIDLADVRFAPAAAGSLVTSEQVTVRGQAALVHDLGGTYAVTRPVTPAAAPPANCMVSLASGHRRRIYYGVPAGTADGFGLGYEEIDQNGVPVPGTFIDIKSFDPANSIVCLQLGFGNKPVKEVWELINVSSEDHNFHIHQTKFRVLEDLSVQSTRRTFNGRANASMSLLPFPKAAVLHDNIPLPSDPSCDGSVASWRGPAPTCLAKPVVVEIAFSQIGDFVYHCHILEHEDGGMMAKMTVIGRP